MRLIAERERERERLYKKKMFAHKKVNYMDIYTVNLSERYLHRERETDRQRDREKMFAYKTVN